MFADAAGVSHRGATDGIVVGVSTGGAMTSLLPSMVSKSNVLAGSWLKDVGVAVCVAHHPLLACCCNSLMICISSVNDHACGVLFSVVLLVGFTSSTPDATGWIISSLSVIVSFF